MTNNKIVSDIKKAGLVTTAVFTLNACGNKQLSESQMQIAQAKTDSTLAVHHEYRMAKAAVDFGETKINEYRNANKNLVKMYAENYIKSSITDIALRRFMLNAIDNESVLFALDNEDVENDTISVNTLTTMRYVRRTQRWFNDMILYLTDKYTEQQLLNSEFFNVINNPKLKRKFEYNTKQIEYLNSCIEFPLKRENAIKTEVLNKYVKEAKRQR